jgi:alanyl-tRNA synthetase
MTERRYYSDSHTTKFEAKIVEHLTWDGKPAVVLDATYFYPTGGGQPCDRGTLNGAQVIDVVTRPDDLAVIHVLEREIEGDTAQAQIDWARRFDHMQQHTGQHILTQAFVQTANLPTVGFHLSPDTVTIDLDATSISADQINTAENLANEVIWRNLPVTARLVSQNEMDGVRVRRIPGQLATEGLRVVSVGEFDQTACGGTHVAATGEIGLLKIIRTDKRGGQIRVEFRCGGRALSDYRLRNDTTQRLTSLLNVGVSELDQSVSRLQNEIREMQRQRKAVVQQLLKTHAAELIAAAQTIDGVRVVILVSDLYDLNDLRVLAKQLTATPSVLALLGMPGEKAQIVLTCSPDLPYNLNPALQAGLAVLGNARGGGPANFVQGGGVPATAAQIEAALNAARAAINFAATS